MASTSEELLSQAEQLQGIIAFFKTDDNGRTASEAKTGSMGHGGLRKKPAFRPKSAAPPPVQMEHDGNGKDRGFALDLGNGKADAEDHEFERY
jgi:methyl-accepting chemotaxis protein